MKTCKLCHDEIAGPAHLICPACAVALDDYTAKKTGVQAEIRAQVIEALEMAFSDLTEWHKENITWFDDDGRAHAVKSCVCYTCREVIPAVKAALEVLSAQIL